MRARLRTGIITTAAITAAVAVWVGVTLPPPAIDLPTIRPETHVVGGYHIHTTRSDGSGTVAEVAAAAARAGLQFVILTDHADATRPPDPPAYVDGVLVLDAVEVNTREGHVVALGLSEASAYPLAGPAADVIADIHRMGGLAVIAHPDSPRSELSWRGGLSAADGIEWINVDSEWRDESNLTLVGRAVHALIRPPQAIAALFARPERTLQRWDAAVRTRPLFGLAALDAHANIGWREQEEPRRRGTFARPSYETLFQTLVQTAIVQRPLTGVPATDAELIFDALRNGRGYSTVRAQAWPSHLELTAEQNGEVHGMGTRLIAANGDVTVMAQMPAAPGVRLELRRDGEPYLSGQGSVRTTGRLEAGAYRVEAYLPGRTMPWVVSNPITIAGDVVEGAPSRGGRGRGAEAPPGTVEPHPLPLDADAWRIERDPSSTGTVTAESGRLRFDYVLGSGPSRGQYAALVHAVTGGEGVQTILFVGTSESPMRVSVQVRLPAGRGREGQRWRTSVYLDRTPRTFELRLQDFEPADRPTARQPIVTPLDSVLFVVDTINARPGSTGTFWLESVNLGVNRMEQ